MNNNQQLRVLYWYINGINKRLIKLRTLILKTIIDTVLLGETKLNPKNPLIPYQILSHIAPIIPSESASRNFDA